MVRARIMSRWLILPCVCVVVGIFPAACTPERARVVTPVAKETSPPEARDYRQMLDQARSKRAGESSLADIARALDRFRSDKGRMPTNLAELVLGGSLRSIPAPPAGFGYAYEPKSGNVRLVPIDEFGKVQVPEDTYSPPTLMRERTR